MLHREINEKFTSIVSGYISRGCRFNTGTMGSGFSRTVSASESCFEITKADLTDGRETVRVRLEGFSSTSSAGGVFRAYRGVRITVSRISGFVPDQPCRAYPAGHKEEALLQETYYVAGERGDASWYVAEGEMAAIERKRDERAKAKEKLRACRERKVGLDLKKAAPLVLGYIRRQPRCKTAKLSDIASVTKLPTPYLCYSVGARGRYYYLSAVSAL